MQVSYIQHWDDKFNVSSWGRYPPEDLVRFVGRNFKHLKSKNNFKVLEVGCGPGANLWFLHREGYDVSGIDFSKTAIEKTSDRLIQENEKINKTKPDLRSGDFSKLPWGDGCFDLVIDIFAVYANPVSVIDKTLKEIRRVLKPDSLFYAKLWGRMCTGFNEGKLVDDGSGGTFDEISCGPCRNMGVAHFFNEEEIKLMYGKYFEVVAIDRVLRTDIATDSQIEEYLCKFKKEK